MTYETLWVLAVMMMGFSMKPGPGMLAFASRAISQRGLGGVLAFMLGNAPVKAIYLLIVIYGFNKLSDGQLFILIMIKALAAVYLIWLGVKGLNKTPKELMAIEPKNKADYRDDFTAGFLIILTNPFDIIIFASVIPTLVPIETLSLQDFWAIYLTLMAAYSVVVAGYTIPLSMTKKFLSKRRLFFLNLISNVAFIVIGVIIGFSALFSADLLPQ